MTNEEIMWSAKEAVKGNRGPLIIGYILLGALTTIQEFIPFVGFLVPLLLTGPIVLGITGVALRISRGEHAETSNIFDGFSNFMNAFVTYLLQGIYIALWTCLLIVPGIIKSFSYAMTFYVLEDNPTMSANDAITESRVLMDGNKWKYFCLQLRFLGWHLLAILTFGILYFWLTPYIETAKAEFYRSLICEHERKKHVEVKAERKKCPLCGLENVDDSRFCIRCGEELIKKEEQKIEIPESNYSENNKE